MIYGYIYKITNTIDGKIYIGRTTRSLESRFKEHCIAANSPSYRHLSYLYNAMRLYGKDKFVIEEVETCDSEEMLNQREIYWIAELHSRDPSIGYNINEGGHGGNTKYDGFVPSENQLKALEAGRHLPASEKLRRGLAERRRGCDVSEETREKLRKMSSGRIHMYKNGKNINPKAEDVPMYLADGWKFGQIKKNAKKKKE